MAASYPEHPGLLIGRGYSELLLPEGDVDEALRNMHSGLRSALRNYSTSPEKALTGVERLVNDQIRRDQYGNALAITYITDDIFDPSARDTIRQAIRKANPQMPALAVGDLHDNLQFLLQTCDDIFLKEAIQ